MGLQKVEECLFLSFPRIRQRRTRARIQSLHSVPKAWTPFLVRLWRVQRGDGFVRSCQLTLLISSGTFPDGSNRQIFSIIFSSNKISYLFNEF